VADTRGTFSTLPDDELAQALRDLARSVAFPSSVGTGADAADLAARVRQRIELSPPRRSIRDRLGWPIGRPVTDAGGRPARRALVIAIVVLLVLAAVAGAVGLGLPGLRIIFGEGPSPRPSASAAPTASASVSSPPASSPPASTPPLGASLDLGTAMPFAEVERLAGFDLLLPTDPHLGPPDAAFIERERAALVWASRADLPDTEATGVGLVLSEFRGEVYDGYFEKILGSDTVLTKVTVGGSAGYWISGSPHFFMYVDPQGATQSEDRRVVGDVLLWTRGDLTFRLETSLGMAAAVKLADSLR
jgi:hypothetical protein